MNWRPSATVQTLQERAELLAAIRCFFAQRKVLEVDTPALVSGDSVDEHISSPVVAGKRFLHSSPELCMKRLLAAGSGDIYQMSHVYRANEQGRRHNTEFMLLEWYRCGFSIADLQLEISKLIAAVCALDWSVTVPGNIEFITYQQAFKKYCDVDPLNCSVADIRRCCQSNAPALGSNDKDGWLDWLGSEQVFPKLGWCNGQPTQTFIVDFPASQAALARIKSNSSGVRVAERFELYIAGVELANGYHELTDAGEQHQRLGGDAEANPEFIAALQHGMPDCSGVALGIDRLLMLLTGKGSIAEVMPFDYERV